MTYDVSIRQHTSEISTYASSSLTYADICWRILLDSSLTYADVCWRILLDSRSMLQHTSVYVCWSRNMRQHASVNVSIRQHTSAYVRDLKVRVISSRDRDVCAAVHVYHPPKKLFFFCVSHSQKKNAPTWNEHFFVYPPSKKKKKNVILRHTPNKMLGALYTSGLGSRWVSVLYPHA